MPEQSSYYAVVSDKHPSRLRSGLKSIRRLVAGPEDRDEQVSRVNEGGSGSSSSAEVLLVKTPPWVSTLHPWGRASTRGSSLHPWVESTPGLKPPPMGLSLNNRGVVKQ